MILLISTYLKEIVYTRKYSVNIGASN